MATFVWSNFGGSWTNMGLCDITMSFTTGLYSSGSEIGVSTSVCDCGACRSCKVDLSDINEYGFDIVQVNNVKDASKIHFTAIRRDFYRYLHESLKEICGAENLIIFDRNIVIKNPSIDVKAIFALFKRKAIDNGYLFDFLPSKLKKGTNFPLQLNSVDREKMIKFISTPVSSVDSPVTNKSSNIFTASTKLPDASTTVTNKPTTVFTASTKQAKTSATSSDRSYWVDAKPTRPGEINLIKMIIF